MNDNPNNSEHAGSPQRLNILVLGHQRSGTSVIARLLAEATGLTFVDDPPWTFTRHVRQVYGDVDQIATYLDAHRADVEAGLLKAPSLTPIAPALETLLPEARFVAVVREPKDTIAAVLEWRRHRDRQQGPYFWDQAWMGIESEDRIEALAQRWMFYHDCLAQLSDPVWIVYDAFCNDKPAAIADAVRQLGIAPTKDVSELADRQFKKDFGDQAIRGTNRWQRELNDQQAETIDHICGPAWRQFEAVAK